MIHDFKYKKHRHVAVELAKFCHEALELDPRFQSFISSDQNDTVIVPVPLHWRRHFQRGFNQAEMVSRRLSKLSGIPHSTLLKRKRYTTTQTRLPRKERLKNLKNAFQVKGQWQNHTEFRQVILVDDVFTTGSTSEACASVIKKECAKVENIVVVTILRG